MVLRASADAVGVDDRDSIWGQDSDWGFPKERPQPTPEPPPAPQQAYSLRRLAHLVLFIGAMAVAGSEFVVHWHHQRPSSEPDARGPAPAIAAPSVQTLYGVKVRGQSGVCDEEARPSPMTGKWRCTGGLSGGSYVVRAPHDPGGPCTHRGVDQQTHAWVCWVRIRWNAAAYHPGNVRKHPLFFGDLAPTTASRFRPVDKLAICTEELRTSKAAAWRCATWTAVPAAARLVAATDPGGRCTRRIADEYTGVWRCLER